MEALEAISLPPLEGRRVLVKPNVGRATPPGLGITTHPEVVAAVIEFVSSFVTLEPGDIISTGTPSGVGSTTGTFLRPGDRVEATISSIGTLHSPVEAE